MLAKHIYSLLEIKDVKLNKTLSKLANPVFNSMDFNKVITPKLLN